MRFHWVDQPDGGSRYETADTGEVLATIKEDGEHRFIIEPGIAEATRVLFGRGYASLDDAKAEVDAVVNERFYNRPIP